MRNVLALLLLAGCASAPPLASVKSKAMAAGYSADLAALAAAAHEAQLLAADPQLAAIAHYWAGYALWQRAVNDVNLSLDPAADRAAALAELDAALAAREPFADAHALAAWLHGWLYTADPANKDAHIDAVRRHLARAQELEPDNLRVLWETAYVSQFRDNAKTRRILEDLVRRPDVTSPRSLDPDWGVPEACMLLAFNKLNVEPKDVASAEALARRALEMRPGWHYVEKILLPQIAAASDSSSRVEGFRLIATRGDRRDAGRRRGRRLRARRRSGKDRRALRYLIDTDVISEVRKGSRCDPNVAKWWEGTAEDELFLSVLTLGEIRKGIENVRRRDARSAVALESWLNGLTEDHADRILPINAAIADEWGRLDAPDPLPVIGGLLAATAKVHRLMLVTRNVPDVTRTGVASLNPWQG